MPLIDKKILTTLQSELSQIRNICILAHVDHGKTTLADSLVASNGIISQKMAGKMRYMDSRSDEQERGITMKSSSISLLYCDRSEQRAQYIVNLIDSPGHVDFSSEVSTAVRLCDGAIVLVDVIEGVCPQTRICLKQAYSENLKPILVLNKIDRLITEKKMTPFDAYVHVSQVLEQVNVVVGHLFVTDIISKGRADENDQTSGLDDVDDSALYFTPETGNVIFCSAVDGWAFTVNDFAQLYASMLGVQPAELAQALWGDFYWNGKTRTIVKGAQAKAKKPLCVQFIFENIWNLYDLLLVRKDREKIPDIVAKLGITLSPRDLRLTDSRIQLQAIFTQWLPIERAVLEQVVRIVPQPGRMTAERAEQLMCSTNQNFASLPASTQALKADFQRSDKDSGNTIVFISKMISVSRALLPANKQKPISYADLEQRKVMARERHQERMRAAEAGEGVLPLTAAMEATSLNEEDKKVEAVAGTEDAERADVAGDDDQCDEVLIAFARVYSGTLRPGDKVFVLMPKHDPRTLDATNPLASPYITEVTIDSVYLLMGRELEDIDAAPAGNIIGIGGLQQVFKTATLSSSVWCPSFCELSLMATPILRVAVEPYNALDLPKLMRGLRILNQADACVQVIIQENGEIVLLTLGEVHLERCVTDLQQTYARCRLNVSPPIVSFRETVVPLATVDMVNESIVATKESAEEKWITVQTANKLNSIRLIAVPLSERVVTLLQANADILKTLGKISGVALATRTRTALAELRRDLAEALQSDFGKRYPDCSSIVDRIWAIGPKKCATNILLNMSDFQHRSIWPTEQSGSETTTSPGASDPRAEAESSFVNGFELLALAGPLVEEPLHGVCFVVSDWKLDRTSGGQEGAQSTGPISGQIMSAVREGCRQAFQAQPQRLVMPMYSCNIVVSADVLGKMYAVIGKRHGKVLSADLTAGSDNFMVDAVLPVIESLNFAQDIRKQTSGLACPQLVFSHWEVLDLDPFWVPSTEEEYLHFGDKADSLNRAKTYMDAVRRRKGLHVEEKLVEHAEKQRTLSKNK